MRSQPKVILKKVARVFAWIVGSVVLLLVLVALLIQIPPVQNWLTGKAVSFVKDRIGTEVSIGGLAIGFPKSIVIKGVYLEDQQGDTLLYAGRLSVDTDLWALTRKEIQLNKIALENVVARVDRAENDSAFNFTYILDAFAGDSTAVPDTLEEKSWNITLETLALEDISVGFDDRLLGNDVKVDLGKFEINMRTFDLEKNAYAVEDIILENTQASIRQTKLLPANEKLEDAEDSAAALVISLEQFNAINVNLSYEQTVLGQRASATLGEVRLLADKIDLPNRVIALDEFSMKESKVSLYTSRHDTTATAQTGTPGENTEGAGAPWKVSLTKLELDNNTVENVDETSPAFPGLFDVNHLLITALNLNASDMAYDGEHVSLDLGNLSFNEQSGFTIRSAKGIAKITEQGSSLQDFVLLTDNSRLELSAEAAYPSLQNISDSWKQVRIQSSIRNSHLNVRDILYFNPAFLDSLPIVLSPATNLQVDAAFAGTVSALEIEHLNFGTLGDTHLHTRGKVNGLPDASRLNLDITLDKFHTTRADLQKILPDTLLPDSFQLPKWMNLWGRYEGSLKKAAFTTALAMDAGSLDARGNINLDSTSALRGMNVALGVHQLAVGSLLGKPDSVMGSLSMQAEFRTTGLSPDEMDGNFAATIDQFDFQGYRYEKLRIDGTIRNQVASLRATMEDKNLDFAIDADYVFSDEIPRYDFKFDLKNADFRALNLSTSPIRARGTLIVDLATADFKVLNGNIGIRKVAVFNGDDLYAVDSLLFASIDQEGRSEIEIDSDLLRARFAGSINVFGLPSVLRQYAHSYFNLNDSLDVQEAAPQHFTFEVELRNTDLLTDLLIPELTTFEPGPIKGEFDSRTRNLDISMEIAALQYGNIGIRSFAFTTESDAQALRYNLSVDRVMIDSTRIDGVIFRGAVANNSLQSDLIILDSADRDKYVLKGTLVNRDDGLQLNLAPEGIVLNYQSWSVPPANFIRFGGDKLVAQNVELANRRERIIIHADDKPGTPLSIRFRELNLEYLTSMVAVERPASGLLDGDIELFPSPSGLTFTSDLSVADFRIRDIPWGDMTIHVAQETKNRFDVDFALTGNENNITVDGYYLAGTSPAMDITARVGRFELTSLQPLLTTQLRDLKGLLTGEIRARGTTDRPDIDGGLTFRRAEFFSIFLNTNFAIDQETISFVDEGIAFDNFEIADEAGNKARLDGAVLTRDYSDFRFRLDLFTDNFRLLNTTEQDNDLFYGKIDLKATARIRGNTTTPIVDLDVGLADGSNLTYIVPQSEASILQAEGIVKFVDRTFEGDPFMRQIEPEAADTIKSTFRGIDLTARIELSDQETFTVVIDPLTKDQLSIRGNATLTLQVDPTGDMNLSGRYEIEEGTYNLSFYKFVKREFQIEKGSYITWLGDPLNAQMNIRAIYNIETSPIELFSNQLTGADPNEVNQYKQRLPFMVYLNLTGELLQPDIAFKLEMPMSERNAFGGNVYARLQDINTRESDLNKQVFALLILKRFISDNPFENKAGGGFESTARNSVSKILSEQLNRLSENIKGVELSFDIKSYEDYSSGQAQGQTELELGVSKSLLNDRLVVKLSGNIDIEGENANRNATDYIGDLALEYKITPDGRLRITGFRNSNYDMIDGELIETGAGLIYVKDYNALSELFKANAETKN